MVFNDIRTYSVLHYKALFHRKKIIIENYIEHVSLYAIIIFHGIFYVILCLCTTRALTNDGRKRSVKKISPYQTCVK